MLVQSGEMLEGTWEELAREAERFAGQRLRVIVLPLTEAPAGSASLSFHEAASPAEWAEAFFTWGRSHVRRNAPPLSEEAINRDSIYSERLEQQR